MTAPFPLRAEEQADHQGYDDADAEVDVAVYWQVRVLASAALAARLVFAARLVG